MKKLGFYLLTLILVVVLIYFIRNNQRITHPKAITVATYYDYLYNGEQNIEIPIYLNDIHHPLTDLALYSDTYLSSLDETKKLGVDLLHIYKEHQESYLSETYLKYIFVFEMPYLGSDYYIEDCYLTLRLDAHQAYTFYIGQMMLHSQRSSNGPLDYLSLHGVKRENQQLSRVEKIHLELNRVVDIQQIWIGQNMDATYTWNNQTLIIELPKADYLLYDFPIIITYAQGELVVHNFKFMIDYVILEESGTLLSIYDLS